MQRHAPNRPIFQSRQFVGAAILIAAIGLPLAPTGAETETPGAKTAPDDSWVILNGKVSAVENSQFILDYDGGNVAVDMGDWNVYDERKAELEGKRITVAGIVDRSDPDHPSIDANSVMYDGIYRYANAADEEGGYYAYPMETLARNANLITARGVVKQVWANEFTLGTRLQDITVNVTGLSENPLLGDDGEPRVEEGDKVSVFGSFDRIEVFDPQKIRAKSVVLFRADGNRARD